ncbi:MAG TPA: hypothetical protein VEY11_03760 [Pyrinomonadaceae bacterium]|nr:hypothetical protein [Pyrinomonadaceae bacterium]
MDKQSDAPSKRKYSDRIVVQYICAYFDHLHSEFLRIISAMDDEKTRQLKERLAPIFQRRGKDELTWDDVYTFDLELLELLSDEDLVRKAYDMRSKYRSIAGARDYDAYIASKPPDLTTLQIESIKKGEEKATTIAAEVLRADIRYLLGQFYLHYSLMPLREGLRDELTRLARRWTLTFITIFGLFVIVSQILLYLLPLRDHKPDINKWSFTMTVAVVIFAGIMGGFVSMLQRIQSAPNEGDALYNLALLSHGWKGISLSPLYGAIFAMLLYVLFTANILQGDVFPQIAPRQDMQTATDVPADTSNTQAFESLPFSDTVPANTKAYALLVIWCFIAGFAERLVPDTLNRLVTKNQSIQGTGT